MSPRRYGRNPCEILRTRFEAIPRTDPPPPPVESRLDSDDEVPGRVVIARLELVRIAQPKRRNPE